MQIDLEKMNSLNWWHSIDLGNGIITPGRKGGCQDIHKHATTEYGMPENLTGKTVLDIGTYNGGYAFEAERRGADLVIATDIFQNDPNNNPLELFNFAKEALGSKVEFMHLDVMDMRPVDFPIGAAPFDIVLFYGVLYHIDNMFGALCNIRKLTKEFCLCETATAEQIDPLMAVSTTPLACFGMGHDNDQTNKWYPNHACVNEMALNAGFSKCEVLHSLHGRSTFKLSV